MPLSMRRAPLTIALGAALWLTLPAVANAIGFGSTKTTTTLGQPLNFVASVSLDAGESLARECVSAIVHAGEARVPPGNVRIALEPAGDGNGRIVRVTTTTLIDEPVVTVEVTVGCTSSMARRFVSFVDPPPVNLAQAQEPAPAPVLQASAAAPILDIVRAADASRRRAAPQPAATGEAVPELQQRRAVRQAAARAERLAAAATRPAAEPRARSAGPARVAHRSGGATFAAAPGRGAPRLRLEAPPPRLAVASAPAATPATIVVAAPVVAAPVAAASSAVAAPAVDASTLAANDPAGEALRREHERIQVLEAGMAKLGSDAQAMQKSMATLQARLREAENDRYANGLVYALAAGMLLFAALALALYLLRPRQRRGARWFEATRQPPGAARQPPPAPRPVETPRDTGPASQPAERAWSKGPPSILPVTAPATIGGLDVTMVLGPEPYRPPAAVAGATPLPAGGSARRGASTSMEELIDMEQQAEFFTVLGQDEAAIELLGAHVAAGGHSPLPYLKLLELHQRRDDRAAYEAVRAAFTERFHARAPEWSADLQLGRSLEQYPTTVARLQSLWPTPMQAMQALDGLLFRRSEGDEAYDFPACRDLLFLYSIARELAGQVETDFGPIDLFLPLDGSQPQASVYADSANTIDLDISNWPDEPSTEPLVIRRSPGRRGAA